MKQYLPRKMKGSFKLFFLKVVFSYFNENVLWFELKSLVTDV